MKTQAQIDSLVNSYVGKYVDFDGYYAFQCMDLAVDYVYRMTDGKTRMWGNAKDAPSNSLPAGWKVIRNEASTVPKKGWIAVWTEKQYARWGHIGLVYNGGNARSFQVLEQNFDGNANTPARLRWDDYSGLTHFLVPPVSNTPSSSGAIKTVSDIKTPSKKRKIMLVAGHGYSDPGAVGNGTNERDFIRANVTKRVKAYLEKEGHEVALYGGNNQSQDIFQDTAHGQNIGNTRDYGLYWVKNQGYDIVVEFHLDAAGASASGGHTIIPYGLKADSVDTGIQKAIEKHVGTIRGITGRSNLLNCNVAKQIGINYRLVELGFITNSGDMSKIKNNIDAYCKDIASAISGAAIKTGLGSSAKPKTKTAPQGWNKNKYGILWKTEKGSFTCQVPQGIITRRTGPGRNFQQAGVLKKGQTVNYTEVQKNDGFVWISWMTNSGYEVYMPIRQIKPDGSLGPLWGSIK
ncbi:N-acetylmuramoyl-L-alanine amidase [Staphylococcus ratti]|uniref:N-acetylmuramoyl-L-alanine amidase n=1 Tax=Staphylococcus ratti TaxID=2892440 RepID=A0ABY3PBP5_9STAP|nr:N-acetylmuramoyl-L-alanine amidase [Staphylococcus ratti]UEX89678.1 N-acetylmuramoyl-L-alanine amidase [Staphylococcus ratti]